MTVVRTASFRAILDRVELVETVVNRFVEAVHAGEPGTRLYLSLRDTNDPGVFLNVMIFDDEAAEAAHAGTEWVKRFTAGLYPNLLGGVTFSEYDHVAGAPGTVDDDEPGTASG